MKLHNWILCATIVIGCTYFVNANAKNTIYIADNKALMNENNGSVTLIEEQELKELININTANAEKLSSLPGIGIKKAENIIAHRELNGDFQSIDEIVNVKGIGKSILEKVKPYIGI